MVGEGNYKIPKGAVSEAVLGGCSTYSSIVANKLGVKAGIVTKKGEDLGEEFLDPLYQIKVDTRGIKTEGPHTTTIQLVYDVSGEKELTYLKKPLKSYFGISRGNYYNVPMFYVCPIDYDVPLETVRTIHETGITIAVDLGGYGGVHCEKNFSIDLEQSKR